MPSTTVRRRRASVLTVATTAVLACAVAVVALTVAGPAPAQAARRTATCTNTSTDASAIQAAINGSAAGDEIVIDGPCLITQTITLLGSRAYRGESPTTLLKEAPGRNLAALLASDSWMLNWSTAGEPISLRDITVDADKADNPTAGDGVVVRSWGSRIENVTIRNAQRNGLRVAGSSRNGTPIPDGHSEVNGLVRGVFVENSGTSGIYVQDSGNAVTDWVLEDCWVSKSGSDAIRLENSAGWMVERNHVYGVGGAGIAADRLYGTSVTGNYVEDFATSGVQVAVQGDTASTVSGNRVFQLWGTGTTFIQVERVNYGSGRLAVTSNVVRGKGTGTGLSYERGSGQLTVTSSGNQVTDVATPLHAGDGVLVTAGI